MRRIVRSTIALIMSTFPSGHASATSMNRLVLAGAVIFGSTWMHAQDTPRFAFDVGGDVTHPIGNTQRHLDNGGTLPGAPESIFRNTSEHDRSWL
jgi:hypothetical protein